MDRLSEIRARCERAQREDFPERVYGSAAYYCVYDDIPYLLSLLEETWEWDMYQCAKREIDRLRGEVVRLTADRWIPVEERLPEEDGRYLVSLGTAAPEELGGNSTLVKIIRFFDGEWKYPVHLPTWINEEITQEVTHWRPLPEAPKGE